MSKKLEMQGFLTLLTDIKSKRLYLLTQKFDTTYVCHRGFYQGLNVPEKLSRTKVMSKKLEMQVFFDATDRYKK